MMIVGIVGAGPCGLHAAQLLADNPKVNEIHVFESQSRPGGRTQMGKYRNMNVVAGAGVVRARDKKLRNLAARYNVPLRRFRTRVQYQQKPRVNLRKWMRLLNERQRDLDRRRTFRQNIVHLFGNKGLNEFVSAAGMTDYLHADVIDTLQNYDFRDNTSGQVMFGIDWNVLAAAMADNLSSKTRIRYRTPVTTVRRTASGKLLINSKWHVDALFWTGTKSSWDVLSNVTKGPLWTKITQGVQTQSFLRAYAVPLDPTQASALYPTTTYMPHGNPLQKIIPVKDGVYMVSYSDNENAITTRQHIKNTKWLKKHTGVAWTTPKVFFHESGTHYYAPLDPCWDNRDAFLESAQHPSPGVYMCGEGLSRKQGWTEGALESAIQAVRIFEACV